MAFGFGFGMPRIFSVARFSPLSLFSGGAPGAWYDPSDYGATGTLFQDSAGTTPVTAVEQPVGLMLDKSQGLVLGSELVVNGDGTSTTGWGQLNDAGCSWTVSGGQFVATTIGVGGARLQQTVPVVAGRTYQISVFANSNNNGGQRSFNVWGTGYFSGDLAASPVVTNGIYTFIVTATSANLYIQLQASNTGLALTSYFDNVSIKSLAGNHAFQATSASRPVLSARYNLLTKTEQFDDAVWLKQRVSISGSTVTPVGTMQGLVEDGTTNSHRIVVNGVTVPASTNQTVSCYAKANTRNFAYLSIQSGSANEYVTVVYDLVNGTASAFSVGASLGTLVSSSATSVGGGVYRLSFVYSLGTKTLVYPVIGLSDSATPSIGTNGDVSYAGNGTSGIFIWGAQLVATNSLTSNTYQRVNTATDYATTGFLPFLRFDGVDDSLSTNSFSISNPITTFDGVRFNSAAAGYVTDSVSGTRLYNLTDGTSRQAGITSTLSSGSITIANTTNVETVIYNGASSSYRRNGAVVSTGNTGSGTISTGLVIGRSQFSSAYLNGQMYSMIIVGKAVTAGELSSTETYVNSKTGAY